MERIRNRSIRRYLTASDDEKLIIADQRAFQSCARRVKEVLTRKQYKTINWLYGRYDMDPFTYYTILCNSFDKPHVAQFHQAEMRILTRKFTRFVQRFYLDVEADLDRIEESLMYSERLRLRHITIRSNDIPVMIPERVSALLFKLQCEAYMGEILKDHMFTAFA